MKVINLTIAFIAINFSSVLFAQDINFSLQDTFPKGSTLIFPSDNGNEKSNSESGIFFVISGSENYFKGLQVYNDKETEKQLEPWISYYKTMGLVSKNSLSTLTPTGKGKLLTASSRNDSLIVILSQKDAGFERCYYQIYDQSCTAISDPVLLSEHKLEEDMFSLSQCVFSENKQFFCLEFIKVNLKNESCGIQYEVRNRSCALVYEDDYESLDLGSSDDKLFNRKRIICNDGSLLIGFYQKKLDEKNRPTPFVQKLIFYRKNKQELDRWELDVAYKKVTQIDWIVDSKNPILYVVGINDEEKDSKSAFYVKYDLKNDKELVHVVNNITFDILMYTLNRVLPDENGLGVVFVMERVFAGASTSMAMNTGTVTTTPKDYFNELLCFKVEEGIQQVPWNVNFNKTQVFLSSIGTSRFGSIRLFQSGNMGYIFFNDHSGNYDEKGGFIGDGKKKLNKVDGKIEKKLWVNGLGIAVIEIDLTSGSTNRRMIFKDKGLIDIHENKSFVSNVNGTSALFFLQRKELGLFGQIKF